MTIPTYFHVGVIVPDLRQAILDFSRILGFTFTEPTTVHVNRLEDPVPHGQDVYVAFSQDGPPYLELIEAHGDGIFSAREEGRILYIGMWEADMAGRIARLAADGIELAAQFKNDEKSPPFCIITKPDVLGIRLEYVDVSDKAAIEEWVRTGKWPGGIGATQRRSA